MTVRGPVAAADLGQTLMHEHVALVTAEIARDFPHITWPDGVDAAVARAVERLREARSRGISTIVDVATVGHRDVAFAQQVNDLVDVNIVLATGYYTFGDLPFFLKLRPAIDRDVLVDMFVHDITVGIQGTRVKAAILKCATDRAGITPVVDRVLRAVAVAHRETGAPITTHTYVGNRGGLDQQRVFTEEGVDLTRVVIGHSGDSADLSYLRELMANGSFIGADRFGLEQPPHPPFDERVATVAALCHEGFHSQIVLSHDQMLHTDWLDPRATSRRATEGITYIHDDVIPALRARGVEDEQIAAMLVENPRRIFSSSSVNESSDG